MEFRAIRQTSHIEGANRNPGLTEHDKALVWDNNTQKVKYVLINGLNANSKTVDGYVPKGDDSAAANYIWKLDGSKNPSWRLEEYLVSIARVGNSAVFTMNSGGAKTVALGALAWEDTVADSVLSVFGRSGDILAEGGDYDASQVTNAFDKLNDTLDDIAEGDENKHFTADYVAEVDANTLARHEHSNKAVLDLITDAGDGVIPTAAQIYEWDTWTALDEENVRDTVAPFIQNNTGISWAHDDESDTLIPTIDLGDFTTDDLPEGVTNKYYVESEDKNVFVIKLPSAASVADRCASAIEVPSGWTVEAGTQPLDLLITHNLGRGVADVKVWSVETSGDRLMTGNLNFHGAGSLAYSGLIAPDTNSILVESLSARLKPITIYVILA